MTQAKKKTFTYDLKGAVTASENPAWLRVVEAVYDMAYGAQGLHAAEVTPVPRELQSQSVDYEVLLLNPHTGHGLKQFVELKTERHPSKRISLEVWNVREKTIEGWPWKATTINSQRLLTVWRDGACWMPFLADYVNWLFKNRARLINQAGKHPDYIPFELQSRRTDGSTYTSQGMTVPTSELVTAFGTSCWYQLKGPVLKRAQEGIDEITRANKREAKAEVPA